MPGAAWAVTSCFVGVWTWWIRVRVRWWTARAFCMLVTCCHGLPPRLRRAHDLVTIRLRGTVGAQAHLNFPASEYGDSHYLAALQGLPLERVLEMARQSSRAATRQKRTRFIVSHRTSARHSAASLSSLRLPPPPPIHRFSSSMPPQGTKAQRGKWVAQMRMEWQGQKSRSVGLGTFPTEEVAARMFDRAAIAKLGPERAKTNFGPAVVSAQCKL